MDDADFQTWLTQVEQLTPTQRMQLKKVLRCTQSGIIKTAYLLDLRGNDNLGKFPLAKALTMICRARNGDASNDDHLFIDDHSVSRSHAIISFHDDHFWLRDLRSTNGTFVNRFRIQKDVRLKHLDIVQFYTYRFQFFLDPTHD